MKNFTSLKKFTKNRKFIYLQPAESQGKEQEPAVIERPEATGKPIEDIARGYREGAERQLAEIEEAFKLEHVRFEGKNTEQKLAECKKIPDTFVKEAAEKLIALIGRIDAILQKRYLTEQERERAISEIYIDLNRIAVSIKVKGQSGDPMFKLLGDIDYSPKSKEEPKPAEAEVKKGLEEAEQAAEETVAELEEESKSEKNTRLAEEVVRELIRFAKEGEGSLTDEHARVISTFIKPGQTVFLEVDGTEYNIERSTDGNYVRLVDLEIKPKKEPGEKTPGLKSTIMSPVLALRPGLDTAKAKFAGSTSLEREREKMEEAPTTIGSFIKDMAHEKTGAILVLNTSINRDKGEETTYQLYKRADGTYEIQTVVGEIGSDEEYAKKTEVVNTQPYEPEDDPDYTHLASITDVDQLLLIPYTKGEKPAVESVERREEIAERVKKEIGHQAQLFADAIRINATDLQRQYLREACKIARDNDLEEGFSMEKNDTTISGKITISVEGKGDNREIVIKVPGLQKDRQIQRLAFLDLGEEEGPEAKKMAA
jgi:hypothetical protein